MAYDLQSLVTLKFKYEKNITNINKFVSSYLSIVYVLIRPWTITSKITNNEQLN